MVTVKIGAMRRIATVSALLAVACSATADPGARLEGCRSKLKQAVEIDLVANMTYDGGVPKLWIGPTWNTIPFDAKEGLAETAACFFLAGETDRAIAFNIYDGMTNKKIAEWSYTKLEID